MKYFRFLFFMACVLAFQAGVAQTWPFQDTTLSSDQRVDDLIKRLTIKEKASLMLYNNPAIERLGIQEYNWWNECLHGVARAGKATVFPQAIGLAATFDDNLVYKVASAISDEARSKHHEAIRKGNRQQYTGLSFWTPNINIFRDPRWGRGQETYGEDPYLTSRMGVAFIKGLQGNDPKYLKVSACAKHYVVHSGPEQTRHSFNALPDEWDFHESYLPSFRALVDAGVESVMCAYNRVYNEPCCGSQPLLVDILRKEWGFKGHVVSDCWALDDIWLRHRVVKERIDAAVMAAKAGVNLNCGYIYQFLPEAVEKGLIDEKLIDNDLRPLILTRIKLGLLNPGERSPFSNIAPSVVDGEVNRKLAYLSAVESIVLLKNNGILPLQRDSIHNLFVTGATANDMVALYGNYNGLSGNMVTLLEGILGKVDAGTVVEYNQGFLFNNDTVFQGFWQASRADAIIICIGINSLFEGEEGEAMYNAEGGDRSSIELPHNQVKFVRMMREKMKNTPIILVVTGGSAIAMNEVVELADAAIFTWYPGEEGGNAVADVLFGNYNPAGRLPVTFYKSTSDLPAFDDYRMRNRTYRYFKGIPQFPFGFGLSFTSFEYSHLRVDQTVYLTTDTIHFDLEVKNTGKRDGDEVIQVYIKDRDSADRIPLQQLKGFQRIYLLKGETQRVMFALPVCSLAHWNMENHRLEVQSGAYIIRVGSSSADIRLEKEILIR